MSKSIHHVSLAAVAAASALALACTDALTPQRIEPLVDRVVLVSIDGLRADALGEMPSLTAHLGQAVWSGRMQTITPALTVPGHLAMFTGRDVAALGIQSNELDVQAAVILAANGASTVFKWNRTAGGTSIALAAFSLIPPRNADAARAFFEVDSLVSTGAEAGPIVDQAIEIATRPDAPSILFVHLPTVDLAGHDHGWTHEAGELTEPYRAAVAEADAQLARLLTAVAPQVADGRVAVIITSDHGGGHGDGCAPGVPAEREHCTAHPGDRTIPLVLLSTAGSPAELTGTPSITQVAPTIAHLLGLPVPITVPPSLLD